MGRKNINERNKNMNIRDLSQYYYISKNIEKRKRRLEELNCSIISSSKISEIKVDSSNHGDDPTSRIGIKIAELKTLLEEDYRKLINEELKINEYINTIDSEEIKFIVISRFIEFNTWDDIAKDMNYSRPVPYQKLKKYLKERNKRKC